MAPLQPESKMFYITWQNFDNICNEMKGSPVVGLEESFDQEGELLASEYCGL